MKTFWSLLCLLLLASCVQPVEEAFLVWGDSDVRYEYNQCPKSHYLDAFKYSVWKGEKAFAQALLWADEGLEGVTVKLDDLISEEGVIPASAMKAQFVKYVWADNYIDGYAQCGYRPKGEHDSLLVADMVDIVTKVDVPAANCQPIWVTVDVPSDTPAGTYSGNLVVKGKNFSKMSLPIEIEVVDEVLPEPSDWKFHLDLWQNPYSVARFHNVEVWSKEHFDHLRVVMQMLADAGQKVITATILDRPWDGQTEDPYQSMVTKTRKADGTWAYDYSIFDKWVEFMMSLGIDKQINCYSLIPWKLQFDYFDEALGEMVAMKAEPKSAAYKHYWGSFISDFAAHLRDKGWFEITCIAMDERPAEAMKAAFEAIMAVEPEFKVSLAGNWHPEIENELYDYCVAFRQNMPREERDKRREQGKVSTYYTCCAERYPNIFTVSPLTEAVWIPWHALAKGYDGYLRWAYNHWTADPLKDTRFRTWTAGDCYCVYPEGRTSLRFDKLLEGIQDYEKARILMERWTLEGDETRLQTLQSALEDFDYEIITAEGASGTVHHAKSIINQ